MRHLVFAALLALPTAAPAQIQIGGNFGVRWRDDDGAAGRIRGIQLEGMIVRSTGRWEQVASLAITQMNNKSATLGTVRENGVEATLLFRHGMARGFGWAIGPAIGVATGCAQGGANYDGTVYGTQTCLVSFANKGTVRPGYALQLDWKRASARGAVLRTGLRAVGHTTASGSKTPKPAVWLGLTLPLTPGA